MENLLKNLENRDDYLTILNFAIDWSIQFPKEKTLKELIKSDPRVAKFPETELELTVKYLSNLWRQLMTQEINENELKSHLSNFLREEFHEDTINTIKLRKNQSYRALLAELNGSNQLSMESFDWDLNFCIGSSALSTMREQFSTLILNTRLKDDLKTITVECNKEKLTKLVQVLESSMENQTE